MWTCSKGNLKNSGNTRLKKTDEDANQPSDQRHGFPVIVRRDNRRFRGPQFTSTFWSIKQHTAASHRKLSAEYDSVASRTSIKETCANMDRETVVSSLFESVSKEKRDRDQNVVQTLKDMQNPHKILERKGEKWLREDFSKLRQKLEVEHWGKRHSDIALCEVNQEFPNGDSCKWRINGLIRLKERRCILCGELEMRNRLFQVSRVFQVDKGISPFRQSVHTFQGSISFSSQRSPSHTCK